MQFTGKSRVFGLKLIIVILSALLTISSCSTHRLSEQQRETLYSDYLSTNNLEKLKRITAFKFHGWQELGKNHLIISSSLSRKYFITLTHPCFELDFTNTIGINRTGSSLSERFDSIFVPAYPEQKCFIKSIHKISREQAKEIVALGKPVDPTKENTDQPEKKENKSEKD